MAIKTKLPIEFSCGHTETVDLARCLLYTSDAADE